MRPSGNDGHVYNQLQSGPKKTRGVNMLMIICGAKVRLVYVLFICVVLMPNLLVHADEATPPFRKPSDSTAMFPLNQSPVNQLQSGSYDDSFNRFRGVLQEKLGDYSVDSATRIAFQRGVLALAVSDYPGACNFFDSALQMVNDGEAPDFVRDGNYFKSLSHQWSGDPEAARVCLQVSKSLDPHNPQIWFRSAMLSAQTCGFGEVQAGLDSTVKYIGDYPSDYFSGVGAYELGDLTGALNDFENSRKQLWVPFDVEFFTVLTKGEIEKEKQSSATKSYGTVDIE